MPDIAEGVAVKVTVPVSVYRELYARRAPATRPRGEVVLELDLVREGRDLDSWRQVSNGHTNTCRVVCGGKDGDHVVREVQRVLVVHHGVKQLKLVAHARQLFLGGG